MGLDITASPLPSRSSQFGGLRMTSLFVQKVPYPDNSGLPLST